MGGIGLILRAQVLVVSKLRLFGKFLHAGGGTVPFVDNPSDILQGIISFVCAGVKIPVLVDRPQLVCRNEFLQALERRNGLVVSLFRRRTPRRTVLVAVPVIR